MTAQRFSRRTRTDQNPACTLGGLRNVRGTSIGTVARDDLLAAVWQVLKTGGDAIGELPSAIAATAAGDPRFANAVVVPVLLAATGPSESAWGTQFSVDCADTGRGIIPADDALVEPPGRYRDFFLFASNAFCDA